MNRNGVLYTLGAIVFVGSLISGCGMPGERTDIPKVEASPNSETNLGEDWLYFIQVGGPAKLTIGGFYMDEKSGLVIYRGNLNITPDFDPTKPGNLTGNRLIRVGPNNTFDVSNTDPTQNQPFIIATRGMRKSIFGDNNDELSIPPGSVITFGDVVGDRYEPSLMGVITTNPDAYMDALERSLQAGSQQ